MLEKTYKYYLFDVDRTLWDFDKNAKNAIMRLIDNLKLKELFGVCNKDLFFERYEQINHALWAKYEKGEIDKEYLRWSRFANTLSNYINGTFPPDNSLITPLAKEWTAKEIEAFGLKMGNTYLEYMVDEKELEPDADIVLKTLKEKGAKIAAVTNGFKEVQYRKLTNSNILEFFDAIIISEEVGVHKPNPAIFKMALEALCSKEEYKKDPSGKRKETIMVGDDFANDIEGAQIFGIDQFYYNPKGRECDGGPTYMSGKLTDIIR